MRPERFFLLNIVEAADHVAIHIGGRSSSTFVGDITTCATAL